MEEKTTKTKNTSVKRRPNNGGRKKEGRGGVAVDDVTVGEGPNRGGGGQQRKVAVVVAASAPAVEAGASFAEQKRQREAGHRRRAEQRNAPVELPSNGPWRSYWANLPFQVSKADFEAFLEQQQGLKGKVKEVALNRGFAHVTLSSKAALQSASQLSGLRFMNRSLQVEVAKPSKQSQGRRRGGGGGGGGGREDRPKFKEHLALNLALEQVEQGLLCRGVLRMNPHNRREAYATIPGFTFDVKFASLSAQNRALDGDVVAIRINPSSDWIDMEGTPLENTAAAVATGALPDCEDEDHTSETSSVDDEDEDNDDATESAAPIAPERAASVIQLAQRAAAADNKRPTGVVVCILEKKSPSKYVGWLRASNDSEELTEKTEYAFLVPFSRKMHRILVSLKSLPVDWRQPHKLKEHLYMCEVTGWKATSICPFGKLVKDYGKGGELEVEKTILLEANNIDFDDGFSREVNACLPPQDYKITQDEIALRRDFRKTLVMSIDPATARDLDDALSIEHLDNGNWRVGVHIADVTHFVTPNTPLDSEARDRATSIYLVNECIPMLPRILSERLCSLNTGQDSLSFSAVFELNNRGDLQNEWFGKGIIRNAFQMSYEVAQSIIDGTMKEEDIAAKIDPTTSFTPRDVMNAVENLNRLAKTMRTVRFENGSVHLQSTKLSFQLDLATGKPVSVRQYVQKPANELVEEFMLLANKRVAVFCLNHFPVASLLRKHERPGLKMKEFVALCAKFGFKVDASSSHAFNVSLANLSAQDPHVGKVIYYLALRSMQLAKYTETDDSYEREQHYFHYALGFQHYTHFTSPIRRYADVMVHRLLQAAVKGLPLPETKDTIKEICDNCNERKVRADRASERSDVVFLCHLFKDKPVRELEGYVYRVTAKGFDVMVPDYDLEDGIMLDQIGLVATSSFDEDKHILSVTYDSYTSEYFDGQPGFSAPDVEKLPKTWQVTMFQRVVVIARIKTEKRELDMGLRVCLDDHGPRSKKKIIVEVAAKEEQNGTCDFMNTRGDC